MNPSASKNPMGSFGLQGEMGSDFDGSGKRVLEELYADDMRANSIPGRKETEAWFLAEIQSLIDFRRQLDAQFNTSESNKDLWQHIAAKMQEGASTGPLLCALKDGATF